MSKEKPYTPYFDEKSRWWKVKGPSQVDAGWTREDHAQRHADDLNAAFSTGAVTREEASEPVAMTNEEKIRIRDRAYGESNDRHDPVWKAIEIMEALYAHPPLAAKGEPRDPKEALGPSTEQIVEVVHDWLEGRECDVCDGTGLGNRHNRYPVRETDEGYCDHCGGEGKILQGDEDLRTRLESIQPTPPPTPS